MIIFGCDTPQRIGGYGDRIVGLVSCKALAGRLQRKFAIVWTKEDIKYFVNYEKYSCEKEIQNLSYETIHMIDNQQLLKPHLMTSDSILPGTCYKIYCNQEIAQYLYKNPLYRDANYYDDMFSIYKTLYTDILLPTEYSLKVIEKTLATARPKLVGIQIRTGDFYMKTNPGESYKRFEKPDIEIKILFRKIKKHIEQTYSSYSVFVSSDYEHIYSVAKEVWSKNDICYLNQIPQHIDRAVAGDYSKVFIDNFILSQKTDRLYISDYSNYGRIAALSSGQDTIYNLQTEILDKKRLLTNMENMFLESVAI